MVLLIFTPLVNADGNTFKGLWEGIDDEDGSAIVVSIAESQDLNSDFEILWRETNFFRCEKKGKGIVCGVANIIVDPVDESLSLDIDAQLHCLDGSKGAVPVQPVLFPGPNYVILATENGSLTLHRISSR